MEFRDIQVEDGLWARPLLENAGFRSCEFSFVNIYMWNQVYGSKITRFQDFVIARSEGRRLHYLYPAGNGPVEEAIDAILEDAAQDGRVPIIFSLNEEAKARLENQHPGRFRYESSRGDADYIYLASDLANLPGKKYQKKRNHCSRFERDHAGRWQFHEITPENMKDVCAFNKRWCSLYDNRDDVGIEQEHQAIQLVCAHYGELALKGGFITVDEEIVAFSFGSALGPDLFVTHVEKALYDVNGAYAIINREMARHFCMGYEYINRENDVDEEGLREAKLSYHPAFLEEKYTAELIV